MVSRPKSRPWRGPRWRSFRRAAIASAGERCQNCGRAPRILHMTRLSTDPADWTRIAILCPSCQARHNTPHRLAASRRTVASRCGQLWLSDELLYAAAPPRFWPDHLRQLPLFD